MNKLAYGPGLYEPLDSRLGRLNSWEIILRLIKFDVGYRHTIERNTQFRGGMSFLCPFSPLGVCNDPTLW